MSKKRPPKPGTTLSRSEIMRRVPQKNTTPEMAVRRALHALGFRFRLHRRDLPGRPDIVLPAYRTCIFVHGCFWHRHEGCRLTTMPSSNVEFWRSKFDANVRRDSAVIQSLQAIGWRCAVVWECETRDRARLEQLLRMLLREPSQ